MGIVSMTQNCLCKQGKLTEERLAHTNVVCQDLVYHLCESRHSGFMDPLHRYLLNDKFLPMYSPGKKYLTSYWLFPLEYPLSSRCKRCKKLQDVSYPWSVINAGSLANNTKTVYT